MRLLSCCSFRSRKSRRSAGTVENVLITFNHVNQTERCTEAIYWHCVRVLVPSEDLLAFVLALAVLWFISLVIVNQILLPDYSRNKQPLIKAG